MAETLVEGLVEGWETMLLAAWYPDNEIQSKVRQNKLLAKLQRAGFPVPIRFHNIQKGPASLELDSRAEAAEEQGYLEYNETPTPDPYSDREEWHLQEDGECYVKEGLMEKLKSHPRGELYLDIFHTEMRKIGFEQNDDLVDEAHESLHLDDEGEFLQRFEETKEALEEWHNLFEDDPPTSSLELAAAAAVELGLEAMTAIERRRRLLDNSTGKNNILWNCERLLASLNDLKSGESMEGPDLESLERELERILNALEVNSAIYDYVDIPSEEELEELFWSAEPSNPEDLIA